MTRPRADGRVNNENITTEMENQNKTDLVRIITVSGQRGLFRYMAQARNGAIVESLSTGARVCIGMKNRITSLADISIYTESGELKLKEVFVKLHAALGENDAPSSKSSADELRKLFLEAVPDYDADRFYVSHMKKVVEWYNELRKFASLDFADDDAASGETERTEEEAERK